MTPILELKDLKINYGVIPALKGISLQIAKGEIVALIGPNGAGKTTTINAVSGVLKREKGSVLFQGKDISSLQEYDIVKRGISQVPEGRGIFPMLTVEENITLGAYLRKNKQEISADMEKIYDMFPRLAERRRQLGGTLSGGEQQMLAIARALMAKPELLLLDEPSMGLAPIIVQGIFKTIHQINKEQNMTILLVEQNAQMALAVAHRAYVLEIGQIVYQGSAKELKQNDEIKRSYLGI